MSARKRKKGPAINKNAQYTLWLSIAVLIVLVLFYRAPEDTEPVDSPAATSATVAGDTAGADAGTADTDAPPSSPALPAKEITVSFIDVGQGDSILIYTDENAVLIDAGENTARKSLLAYLEEVGIKKLDFVVATHPHSDHIGSMSYVIDALEVGEVLMPDVTHNTATFERMITAIENKDIPITIPEVGQTYEAGLIVLQNLAPSHVDDADLNDASLVFRLVYGDTSFMFTGDAETPSEKVILETGLPLQSNVLKAGHHGSSTSTMDAFLDAVAPKAVVISCGKDNSYGHPHRETMEKLAERNIPVYRTDEMGTIVMTTDGRTISLLNGNE